MPWEWRLSMGLSPMMLQRSLPPAPVLLGLEAVAPRLNHALQPPTCQPCPQGVHAAQSNSAVAASTRSIRSPIQRITGTAIGA